MDTDSNQIQHNNAEVIRRFYDAFAALDYTSMQSCYAEGILFSDPVFGLLEGEEVLAMWEMLCRQAKEFRLQYDNIQCLDNEYATCDWTAHYVFSKTGRPVVNRVRAHMRMANGIITEHSDAFRFYTWSRQALGISGWLLGWSSFFHRKVSRQARNRLGLYLEQRAGGSNSSEKS